jgi:hypothetical protein
MGQGLQSLFDFEFAYFQATSVHSYVYLRITYPSTHTHTYHTPHTHTSTLERVPDPYRPQPAC